MAEQFLCDVSHIGDGCSAGYALQHGKRKVGIMAIRQGNAVHTYRNACPHIGAPLDFRPGQFLDKDREHILCSTHGALFRIEDGYCISGPCAGGSLTQIRATIRDNQVYVDLDADQGQDSLNPPCDNCSTRENKKPPTRRAAALTRASGKVAKNLNG